MAPRAREPAADLPTALAAAIVDPGRIEVRGAGPDRRARDWIAAQPAVGASLLADDPRPRRGTPLALAVAGADGRVVAADGAEASDALRHLVEASGVPLVGHEVKPVLVAGFADDLEGPATPVAFDTQVAAYILNAALRSQTIADVVAENLDQILPPATELPATARAGLEALSAIAVRDPLERRLADVGLDRLFRDIELPLIPVLARMEAVGVALDLEALAGLAAEFGAEIDRLEQEIYRRRRPRVQPRQPEAARADPVLRAQPAEGPRTKTGFSTDASVLEDLRPAHPMIDKLLEWRIYTKLRSTYVEALPSLIAEADGRLHTTFHQAVAATGRLSSSDPNLQNIPIRTALGRRIRRAFVAGEPHLTLLAADYSQIELRILAHVSGDEHLKDAFARNADIHRETAARVLHKDPADITHGERSMAKMVNFGLAYGMSDFGLASRANIPRKDAQEFINSYFAAYSGISYYMMAIKEQAKRQGYVETLLGRKRADPRAPRVEPGAARGRRADGDQHADPGHGRRHPEDRDDPDRRARPRRPASTPGCCSASTTSCSSRCRATRSTPLAADRPRDDGGRPAARRPADGRHQGRRRLGGDDPAHPRGRDRSRARRGARGGASRADPRLGCADARASRGRDRRPRPPTADHRRHDRRRDDVLAAHPARDHAGGVRRRDRRAADRGRRPARQAARDRAVRATR